VVKYLIIMSLKGKIALITGASRAEEGLIILKNELKEFGIDILICPYDLKDPKVPKIIIEKVIEYFGGLDILINNAGIALAKPIIETTEEEWDEIMAVNAKAPFLLCKYAIPYLKKSEMPTIINISSVVGTKGYVNQGAYTASKHALMGFTKVLAQEVHDDGIRVHVISPGGVATDLVTIMRPDLDPSTLIKPEEIAEIVVFLLKFRGNAVIDEINVRREKNPPWR
jgi:3-oxoacyl-[acyl-carrier protein] reductase